MKNTNKELWVFIRGLGRESGHWFNFPQTLKSALDHDIDILNVDLPGCGIHHLQTTSTSLKELSAAAYRDLLKYKGDREYQKKFLVGMSLGGMVAIDLMQSHTTEFDGAILMNTSLGKMNSLWHRLKISAFFRCLAGMFQSIKKREKIFLNLCTNSPNILSQYTQKWTAIQMKHPVSNETIIRQLAAAATFRPLPDPPQAPILMLASRKDRLVSYQCSVEIAAQWKLPLESHPTAGHDISLDDGEWVSAKIKNFYESSLKSF